MYKGGVEGTVLANRSKGFQNRDYDKDDLTKLFQLEADGVCESLELSLKAHGSALMNKCSTPKNHGSIVGISRRSSAKTT